MDTIAILWVLVICWMFARSFHVLFKDKQFNIAFRGWIVDRFGPIAYNISELQADGKEYNKALWDLNYRVEALELAQLCREAKEKSLSHKQVFKSKKKKVRVS